MVAQNPHNLQYIVILGVRLGRRELSLCYYYSTEATNQYKGITMKISNSNKKAQTVTITGGAAEMALLLDLAEKHAQLGYNKESEGMLKTLYSECIEEYNDLQLAIRNGDMFA